MDRSFIVVLSGLATVLWAFWLTVTPITGSDSRWYRLVGTPPPALLDPFQAMVLPPSAGAFSWRCSVDVPLFHRGFFTPGRALVAKLEVDLSHFLPFAEALGPAPYAAPSRPPLSSYPRQYLGVHFANGDTLVIINAFRSVELAKFGKPMSYWRRRFVDVCDGGPGFWHVEYDPVQRRFRRFSFNGAA